MPANEVHPADDGKVTQLRPAAPDRSPGSRLGGDLPLYRDPMIQLVCAATTFFLSFAGSLVLDGPGAEALQVSGMTTALLGAVVLLRSVRNGWNVKAYGRARKAMRREATVRIERDALREISSSCATRLRVADASSGVSALQQLVEEIQHVLARSSGDTSVAVAEEAGGRFHVLCVAGFLRSRPYYVAQGKSCPARLSFTELLETFCLEGGVASQEVWSEGRRYWVGAITRTSGEKLDEGLVDTIAAWVAISQRLSLLPKSFEKIGHVG